MLTQTGVIIRHWGGRLGTVWNMYFQPRPRPSGLRRSDPDRDLPNYSSPSHFSDFPLLQWWPCSWLTEDCQVLPSSFSSCHPPVRFEPATPGKRGWLPILPTKMHQAVTHPITNAAILLNLSDLRGSHSSTFPLVTGKSSGGDHPWYPVCHNLWSWCFRTDDMSRTSWTEGTSPILDHGRVVKKLLFIRG